MLYVGLFFLTYNRFIHVHSSRVRCLVPLSNRSLSRRLETTLAWHEAAHLATSKRRQQKGLFSPSDNAFASMLAATSGRDRNCRLLDTCAIEPAGNSLNQATQIWLDGDSDAPLGTQLCLAFLLETESISDMACRSPKFQVHPAGFAQPLAPASWQEALSTRRRYVQHSHSAGSPGVQPPAKL
jgi:hypothetical protein